MLYYYMFKMCEMYIKGKCTKNRIKETCIIHYSKYRIKYKTKALNADGAKMRRGKIVGIKK